MDSTGSNVERDRTLIHQASHPAGLDSAADLILRTQRPCGEIPWSPGQKTDPWDHVEAAMGLATAGHPDAAARAYRWLARHQLPDGSWYSAYLDGVPLDRTRDANFCAYIAVGVYHHWLVTRDRAVLEDLWPTVAAAIDFALSLQAPGGEIHWAISPDGRIDPMALLTGSSSIHMSVRCALAAGAILGRPRPQWEQALQRLGDAIRFQPHLFNMAKARFSMDWFYPVLAGVVTGPEAERRVDRGWRRFVVEGLGVRCVSDQPWIAVAETTELVLALAGMGRLEQARVVFGWIGERRFEDGAYWAGFTFPDMTVWPQDRLTWTNAGVLLAADAIFRFTPGADLFSRRAWGPARG
jgi:hypothetical protein